MIIVALDYCYLFGQNDGPRESFGVESVMTGLLPGDQLPVINTHLQPLLQICTDPHDQHRAGFSNWKKVAGALPHSWKSGCLRVYSSVFFSPITDFVEGHCTLINKGKWRQNFEIK